MHVYIRILYPADFKLTLSLHVLIYTLSYRTGLSYVGLSCQNILYLLFLSRFLSVILVVDLSKPKDIWGTTEKLLQATQGHLEKAFSMAKKAQTATPAAAHRVAIESAARVLPTDYPVRSS